MHIVILIGQKLSYKGYNLRDRIMMWVEEDQIVSNLKGELWMPDAVKLTRFVSNYLFAYGIKNKDFLIEIDEDYNEYSTAFPDGEIKDEVIEQMMLIMGLTREELFSMDSEVLKKYSLKFPFFALDKEFQSKYSADSAFLNIENTALFGYMGSIERYDKRDIKKRVIQKAMEIDDVIEGTYHSDATPVGLCYSTEWMISFPKYRLMVSSLLRAINRYKNLFVKAINADLNDEEIREMNFLASSLDARDLVTQNIILYHHNVIQLKEVYRKESLNDFFSYVIIGRMKKTKYWRCDEFLDDKKLLGLYIKAYPEAFSEMRKYLMRTENFSCWFYWSDDIPDEILDYFDENEEETIINPEPEKDIEKPIETSNERYIMSLSDEEFEEHKQIEAFLDDYDDPFLDDMIREQEELEEKVNARDLLGISYIDPESEIYKEEDNKLVHLYIEKKPEEQYYNTPYYERLKQIIQPEKKGGFPYPKRECTSDMLTLSDGELFDRRAARTQAMAGGV